MARLQRYKMQIELCKMLESRKYWMALFGQTCHVRTGTDKSVNIDKLLTMDQICYWKFSKWIKSILRNQNYIYWSVFYRYILYYIELMNNWNFLTCLSLLLTLLHSSIGSNFICVYVVICCNYCLGFYILRNWHTH